MGRSAEISDYRYRFPLELQVMCSTDRDFRLKTNKFCNTFDCNSIVERLRGNRNRGNMSERFSEVLGSLRGSLRGPRYM